MAITETVLEMHFHKPLMDLIRWAFGLGPNGQMNFYKWSTQKECFVGFDQAYVKTQLQDDEFFQLLKTSAESRQYQLNDIFFGYFLQFKVVQLMRRRTDPPPQITNLPYYRVNLDTTKNKNTGVSQHELLYRLSKNKGAMVYYACPMVFDKIDLYASEANLDQLQLADLESCQDIYDDNGHHYIYFDNTNSVPIWTSEPHIGRAISSEDFVSTLVSRYGNSEPLASRKALLDILTDLHSLGISEEAKIFEVNKRRDILRLAAESLMIVRIRRE